MTTITETINVNESESNASNVSNASNASNESNGTQVNETREQLRARLKQKINSKRTNRTNGITRKKSNDINDSFKKITEVLANKNIQSPDQIDSTVIETIMNIISKKDMELILQQMQNNSMFKQILETVSKNYEQ